MRLFNNIRKTESFNDPVFNKEQIIKEILENKISDCPGWNFFRLSNNDFFDTTNCDFIAIYTDVINKEIRFKSNPFSEYKRTVESTYQIVREIYVEEDKYEENINCEISPTIGVDKGYYKKIIVQSAKELFIKLKNEV